MVQLSEPSFQAAVIPTLRKSHLNPAYKKNYKSSFPINVITELWEATVFMELTACGPIMLLCVSISSPCVSQMLVLSSSELGQTAMAPGPKFYISIQT